MLKTRFLGVGVPFGVVRGMNASGLVFIFTLLSCGEPQALGPVEVDGAAGLADAGAENSDSGPFHQGGEGEGEG